MKSLRYALYLGVAALVLPFSAVAQSKDTASVVIAMVPKGPIPWFIDCDTGAKAEAGKLGVKYEWVMPRNTQGSTQVQVLEDLVAKKVDGIGISVNEAKSVVGAIKQATDAGVKVLTYDDDSPDSARSMYIGTDNVAAGRVLGAAMAKALDGKGEVAIVTGELGAAGHIARIKGVKEAFEKYPDIKVVAIEGTNDDLGKAVAVDEALLRGHPNLAGMVGISQVGAPSIAKVLNEKEFEGRKGKIQVYGFDDLPDALKAVREGVVGGLVVQRPTTMCGIAVDHLLAQIQGKEAKVENIDTGVTVVTKDNISNYTK
jgi:ribose transport system substrate-binding protein